MRQMKNIYSTGMSTSINQVSEFIQVSMEESVEKAVRQLSLPLFQKARSSYRSGSQSAIRKLAQLSSSGSDSTLLLNSEGRILESTSGSLTQSEIDGLFAEIKEKKSGDADTAHIVFTKNDGVVLAVQYLPDWKWYLIQTYQPDSYSRQLDSQTLVRSLQGIHLLYHGYAEILDAQGRTRIHPLGKVRDSGLYRDVPQRLSQDPGYSLPIKVSQDTNDLYVSKDDRSVSWEGTKTIHFIPVKGLPWIIALHEYRQDQTALFKKTRTNIIIIILIYLISIMLISLFISRSLGSRIQNIDTRLEQIISGKEKSDLTRRIEVHSHNELDSIANKFNSLMMSFNRDMLQVKNAAVNLSQSSEHLGELVLNKIKASMEVITSSIQSIQENTLNQTSGVEEVNATLEEMSRSIDSMSDNMSRQSAAVEESASAIEEMSRNIDHASATAEKTMSISKNLNQVATEGGEAVKNSMSSIKDVSEYSQQILKMLKLITDISKQTNLLAMNASIEAAHAGEAGKGFAIVADEIRRLAENTSKNAKDIGDVVNAIVEKIDQSVTLSEKAGMGLDMILAYSNQNVNIMGQLNSALEEQNHSAKEILKSTQDMVLVTEEVQVAMNEQRTGTHEFAEIMRNLRDISLETKDSIQNHITKLNQLITAVEEIKEISDQNNGMSGELMQLIDHFVLDETEDEADSTSLKLVE